MYRVNLLTASNTDNGIKLNVPDHPKEPNCQGRSLLLSYNIPFHPLQYRKAKYNRS